MANRNKNEKRLQKNKKGEKRLEKICSIKWENRKFTKCIRFAVIKRARVNCNRVRGIFLILMQYPQYCRKTHTHKGRLMWDYNNFFLLNQDNNNNNQKKLSNIYQLKQQTDYKALA